MPRYILIDNDSGFIFGDTADFALGEPSGLTPTEAANALDVKVAGVHDRTYEFQAANPHTTETGYHVYRADVGDVTIPVVLDGQDKETIEAVERDCEYIGFVFCRDAETA